jgi:NADP-dependent 3-hydroxy acid dehydrogenase YdfG
LLPTYKSSGESQRIIEAAISWAGGLDNFIDNAGLSRGAALKRSDPADLRAMLETIVWSLVELNRLAMPHLKAAGSADILNIGYVAARAKAPDSTV